MSVLSFASEIGSLGDEVKAVDGVCHRDSFSPPHSPGLSPTQCSRQVLPGAVVLVLGLCDVAQVNMVKMPEMYCET